MDRWPPSSYALTPLDNFLPLINVDKPVTKECMKGKIRRIIVDIRPADARRNGRKFCLQMALYSAQLRIPNAQNHI